MNLDRTFCSGLRCGKANTCDRWTEHLKKWLEKNPNFKDRPISVAQFADHAGNCTKYQPKEEEKKKEQENDARRAVRPPTY